jgi:peptidoglycan/LPS O-acetylase OafA/YrhL
VFGFGHAGVDFFFVLSGFIISFVHNDDIGKPGRLGRYAWRRLTRIYPIYWFITIFEVARAAVSDTAAERLGAWHLVRSAILLPDAAEPPIGVAWTLEHEMLFYCAFALAIASRRTGFVLLGLCLVLGIANIALPSGGFLFDFLASAFHLQFLMGIAAARIVSVTRVPGARIIACLGAVAFLIVGLGENAGLYGVGDVSEHMLFGAASMAVIVGMVGAERDGTLQAGGFTLLLGDASYVLYLLHLLVGTLFVRAMGVAGLIPAVPPVIALIVATLGCVASGIVVHLYIEMPALEWIRRRAARFMRARGSTAATP